MRGRSSNQLCRGLTLIELCLVLALLVVITSFTVPIMAGSMSRASLVAAGETLRGAFSKGRLAAMQTGEPCVFRFEPKGARFQLTSLSKLSVPESSEVPVDNSDGEYSPHDMLRLRQSRLPEHVIFAAGDVAASTQVAALSGSPSDGPWSQPILFNPDGTTSDASLVLQNDRGQTIRVTLRGLTGVSSAGDVCNEAAP